MFRVEIEPYKNILANKDFSSKLLIIVVGLMLPGLLIVSYVFLTIKYLVMTFIAGVLGLIIVRLFRFEISFNEILKSALFATSPFIILDIIRMVFSLNFYFMHYLIYVVFLSLVIVRIGEFGDREAMSAKRKKKGREKGGNDFVEVDDIKWDKFWCDKMIENIHPRQITLVTCRAEMEIMGQNVEKDNLFTLGWHTPLSETIYGITVLKKNYSYKLISKSRCFCVNFLPHSSGKDADFCGNNHGEHQDKFKATGFSKSDCSTIDCCKLSEAVAWLECEVENELDYGDHVLFSGKILKSLENSKLKDERRLFYLGDGKYTTTLE